MATHRFKARTIKDLEGKPLVILSTPYKHMGLFDRIRAAIAYVFDPPILDLEEDTLFEEVVLTYPAMVELAKFLSRVIRAEEARRKESE